MREWIVASQIGWARSEATGEAVAEFRFGADAPVFAGHFPGRPLLPGVFQLEMTRVVAEEALDCPLAIRDVCQAKFLRPILPDEVARLELKWTEDAGLVQARAALSVGGQPAGVVKLRLCRSA